MSKNTGQTVITLVLPDQNSIQRQGSIIAKYENGKQSIAHVMPFNYVNAADITRAIEAAQRKLEALKADPPQVKEAAPTSKPKKSKLKRKKKKKPSLDDFPQDDDELEVQENISTEVSAPDVEATPTSTLKAGDAIRIYEGAVDLDGDPVQFSEGHVCEIDDTRIWVESADGSYDVWLRETDLERIDNVQSVNTDTSQLTLFG